MEIFKQLKNLGYKHYVDLTIEELDNLPINNIEKRIEYSLVIDWFREKYDLHIVLTVNPYSEIDTVNGYKIYDGKNELKCIANNETRSWGYYYAREQAILKALELIKT